MKHLGTIVGGALAGIYVMTAWGAFAGLGGILGGWFAGLAIIGPVWLLNHGVGVMNNDGAWVDQGIAIGVCGTFIPVFADGSIEPFVKAIPTLAVVLLGACVGGITAGLIQKSKEVA